MAFTGMFQIAAVMAGFGQLGAGYQNPGSQSAPTKSAVVGMLAAALGRTKSDSITDLNQLLIGTCTTNAGVLHTRFGTITGASQLEGGIRSNPLIRKKGYFQAATLGPGDSYLVRHIVAFQSEDEMFVQELLKALTAPVFPVFVGRANCRPAEPMPLGYLEGTLEDAFALIKVPTTAIIEVLPSDPAPNKRRVMDTMDSLSGRNAISRFVVQRRLAGV